MDRLADPAKLLDALSRTLDRFQAASVKRSPAQLLAAGSSGEWSPNEILWHIRASADVYGEHIERILAEEAPSWRHVSPRARMKKARYDQVPFADSLAAFTQQRAGLVAMLEGLPANAWQRFAIVRADKRERRLTLQERVAGMVHHEEIHCREFEHAVGKLRTPA
jgi:hypothetical protein